MSGAPRSTAARIGIAALNLVWPGLGLIRLQRSREALRLIAVPFVMALATIAAYALLPVFTFAIWVTIVLISAVIGIAAYAVAIVLSWRWSRDFAPDRSWWSRWYSLSAIAIACFAAYWPAPDILQAYYRAFYMPAESMEPTLLKGDRFVAHMRQPTDLARGSLVLVDGPDGNIYIKRVAARAGDLIAMQDGVVILNGRPVRQLLIARTRGRHPWGEPAMVSRLAEQFPGEARPHQILDSGVTSGDFMPEQRIASGHVFVLGDNRDLSADSRFSTAQMGLEQVPMSAIRGQALFYYWGSDNRRMGEPLNR